MIWGQRSHTTSSKLSGQYKFAYTSFIVGYIMGISWVYTRYCALDMADIAVWSLEMNTVWIVTPNPTSICFIWTVCNNEKSFGWVVLCVLLHVVGDGYTDMATHGYGYGHSIHGYIATHANVFFVTHLHGNNYTCAQLLTLMSTSTGHIHNAIGMAIAVHYPWLFTATSIRQRPLRLRPQRL